MGCALLFSVVVRAILKSPFQYPYLEIIVDISGKRAPQFEDIIDAYIIEYRLSQFTAHLDRVEKWKKECENIIRRSPLKKLREQQYYKSLDDFMMFCFKTTLNQTRYKQTYYVKSSYQVEVVVSSFSCDYFYIKQRHEKLKAINFETTLREYNAKDQRKRMTKQLRQEIAKRDGYTCQICGKYMPDEVGLHIDHIVPVSKGGKSVPSNLQVLCSKCNGQKSTK